ncbi:tetratricopeptide repeat protein [Bernardetia sp. OM2101]|uniref:tetratricopeptide repeat protein n=1 Tax=Bernardetia sp. OM2101 TaxID=3344876 RepID=UPI0035CFF385
MYRNSFIPLLILLFFCFLSACQSDTKQFVETLPPLPDSVTTMTTKQVQFLNEQIEQSENTDNKENTAHYYYKRASLYLSSGKENIALDDIEKAISLDSTKSKYYFALAEAYQQRNEPQKVLEAAQKAIDLGFTDLELYRLYAYSAFTQKKWSESLSAFEEIAKRTGEKTETLYYQGMIWNKKNDTTKAISFLRKAIAKDSTYIPAYTEIVKTYNTSELPKNAWKEAQIAFQKTNYNSSKKIISTSDNKIRSQLSLHYGNTWLNLNKRDSSIVWYRKAIKQDSTLDEAALQVGIYMFEKRYYPQAEYYFKKVIEQKPSQHTANYLLGVLYEYKLFEPEDKIKRFEMAQNYFQNAYKADTLKADYKESIVRIERKIEREKYKLTPEYAEQMKRLRLKEQQRQDSIGRLILTNPIF